MILLTRLNGSRFGINADLIERVETTGDTVISLIDGTKYVVAESPADIVDRIIEFRARVLAGAELVAAEVARTSGAGHRAAAGHGALRLVVERTDADPDGCDLDRDAGPGSQSTHDHSPRSADAGPERS